MIALNRSRPSTAAGSCARRPRSAPLDLEFAFERRRGNPGPHLCRIRFASDSEARPHRARIVSTGCGRRRSASGATLANASAKRGRGFVDREPCRERLTAEAPARPARAAEGRAHREMESAIERPDP